MHASSFPATELHQRQAAPAQRLYREQPAARKATIQPNARAQQAAARGSGPHRRHRELVCSICAAAGAASLPASEAHEGPSTSGSDTVAKLRGFLFYTCTFLLALPLFIAMLLLAPFVALIDKHRRLAQHFVNNLWAKVEGRQHLPAVDEPAVYVANHQSFLDIFTLFHLNRPFKFISKTSNFYIPIVGWSMFLTGHVMLNRVDRRSQLECLSQCRRLLQRGASVLFFPEGTRSKDRRLQEFKKGAFSVAAKAGVPVVPVTLLGTGAKMPNGQEGKMFPGEVRIVIHPPVQPGSADTMMSETRAAIASSLPSSMLP